MDLSVFLAGLTLDLSLIVCIGAQNAFVLRQGLRNEHVFAVCLVCALSDAVLIPFGVLGFGRLLLLAPWLDPVMRYGGAAFLIGYGARSLWSAWRATGGLVTDATAGKAGLGPTLMACLAFTWLNPQVYLDVVGLLGALSTQFEGHKAEFIVGAITGSVLFFFALGYGAVWLRPVLATPRAWRILEAVIGVVMWLIGAKLLCNF
ncbi:MULTISPECIES: LysE/ArgO family amino acid transporter [Asticcacaulis]|uniref:LysE/ArgO family amino acid transporter n=1 Tax=Asticcacaulis TaxID=76890 RepID=UPI001AE53EE5|nr:MULTISPECIES: LysE/ArgO family amino acid transporter [Asticcacaulis]MBP2161253.1 L-lysine exporter family protein LysE/ArgO [Asticcacaulis solisilvae]MDR6802381.1 L-lysine exporter family protein LysE/ArgO [Asticcacaulis sp. BE141]